MNLPKLEASLVYGKIALVRVDYNVPLKKVGENLKVADDRRILTSLDTIHFLLKKQAKVVLMSHLGRPKSSQDLQFSLKPIVKYLRQKQNLDCQFLPQFDFEEIKARLREKNSGQLFLLENLRFNPEEKANDLTFAQKLASLGDIFVNEAFSTSHRKHASTYTLAKLLPHFAGFGLIREVNTLEKLLLNPTRPFVCLIGGGKISDKVPAIANLAQKADIVLTGGSVANTFLSAEGIEVFRSKIEEETKSNLKIQYRDVALDLIKIHKHEKMLKDGYIPLPKIVSPVDALGGLSIDETNLKNTKIFDLTHDMQDQKEKEKWQYFDIGPKTQRLYQEIIAQAKTVFWNGPMGVWENPIFAQGTKIIAQAVAKLNQKPSTISVLGGGDTLACVDHFGLNNFSYLSTGGGATLELLSGSLNPGIAVLCID